MDVNIEILQRKNIVYQEAPTRPYQVSLRKGFSISFQSNDLCTSYKLPLFMYSKLGAVRSSTSDDWNRNFPDLESQIFPGSVGIDIKI